MHTAENVKGINIHSVAKYKKNSKDGLLSHYKNFRKKSHSVELIQREDPLGSSGFPGYLQKVKKMKGGPFALSLPWPDLALGGFRNISKNWTDQCE